MSKLAIQGGDKAITLDQSEASEWPIIDDEVTKPSSINCRAGRSRSQILSTDSRRNLPLITVSSMPWRTTTGPLRFMGRCSGLGSDPAMRSLLPLQRFGGRICPSSPVRRFRSSAILIRSPVARIQEISNGGSPHTRKRLLLSISVECQRRWMPL